MDILLVLLLFLKGLNWNNKMKKYYIPKDTYILLRKDITKINLFSGFYSQKDMIFNEKDIYYENPSYIIFRLLKNDRGVEGFSVLKKLIIIEEV